MITKTQQTEIRKYLSGKKLSKLILMEVYDHFISQISQMQINENFGFEEAFLKTKLLWQKELKMVKADFLSFKSISVLEKKLLKNRFNKIIVTSSSITFLYFFLNLFFTTFSTYLLILLFFSGLVFLIYSLIARKITLFEYINLSFHPLLLRIQFFVLVFLYFLMPIFLKTFWSNLDVKFTLLFSILVFQLALQMQLILLHNKKINILI